MNNYVFFYSNHNEDDKTIGITGKVKSQILSLRRMGLIVFYSAYTNKGIGIFDNDDKEVFHKHLSFSNNAFGHFKRRKTLIDTCITFLEKTSIIFNYGYLRFHFFDKRYLSLLKSLKKRECINIVEAHVYPYRVRVFSKFLPFYIIDRLYLPIVRKYIDLVAGITECSNIWGVKTINIDNAIDLSRYSLANKTPSNEIRIISVSNETKAHGYDKVIKGLYYYYKNGGKETIVLNFVGTYLQSTIKLIKKYGLSNRVVFWGRLSGKELDSVFNQSDLGLGAFSYRKKTESGSCIKTKEYFARGIPFINGWKEPAFDDKYPYVLKVETKTSFVDFNKVVSFYKRLQNDSNVSLNMRIFAESNYSWDVQMSKVFKEFYN